MSICLGLASKHISSSPTFVWHNMCPRKFGEIATTYLQSHPQQLFTTITSWANFGFNGSSRDAYGVTSDLRSSYKWDAAVLACCCNGSSIVWTVLSLITATMAVARIPVELLARVQWKIIGYSFLSSLLIDECTVNRKYQMTKIVMARNILKCMICLWNGNRYLKPSKLIILLLVKV